MISEIGRRGGTFKLSPGELLIYCRNKYSKNVRSEDGRTLTAPVP